MGKSAKKEHKEKDKDKIVTPKKDKKEEKKKKKSKKEHKEHKEHEKDTVVDDRLKDENQKNVDDTPTTDAVVGKKRKRSKDGDSDDKADTTEKPAAKTEEDDKDKKRSKKKAKSDKRSKKESSKAKKDVTEEKPIEENENEDKAQEEAKDTQTSADSKQQEQQQSSSNGIESQESSHSNEQDATRWGYDDKAMIKMYGSNANDDDSDLSDDEKDDEKETKDIKDKNEKKDDYDEQLPYTFDENDNPIYVKTQDDKEIFLCKLCPAKKMATAKQVATHLASGHHARRLNRLKKQKQRIAKGLPPVQEKKQKQEKKEEEDPDKPFEMPIIKTRGKERSRADILKLAKLQKLSNQTRKEERESQLAAKLDEKRRMAIIQLKRDGKEPTTEAVAEIVWQWTEDERLERIKRRRIKRIEVKLRTGRIKSKPRGKEGKNDLRYLPRNLEKWLDNAKKRKLKRKQRKENRKKVEEQEAAKRKKGLLKKLDSLKDI